MWKNLCAMIVFMTVFMVQFSTVLANGKLYGPGVSDTEVKIGQTMPYSGPASVFGTIGKAMSAYFNKINEEGGINGRRIILISLDDGFSPPKTVEQTRRLVEAEKVWAIFSAFGTPTNVSIQRYLNHKKVPHLFSISGSSRFSDPKKYPWSMGGLPTDPDKGAIYGEYVLQNYPKAKVGLLYMNDDYGKGLGHFFSIWNTH